MTAIYPPGEAGLFCFQAVMTMQRLDIPATGHKAIDYLFANAVQVLFTSEENIVINQNRCCNKIIFELSLI